MEFALGFLLASLITLSISATPERALSNLKRQAQGFEFTQAA
jgi:hypothetical protein